MARARSADEGGAARLAARPRGAPGTLAVPRRGAVNCQTACRFDAHKDALVAVPIAVALVKPRDRLSEARAIYFAMAEIVGRRSLNEALVKADPRPRPRHDPHHLRAGGRDRRCGR